MDKKKRGTAATQATQSSVQMFTQVTEMKFKPASSKGTSLLPATPIDPLMYDPMSMVHTSNRKIEQTQSRRLKFNICISSEHFLIGNENQLDMIGFGSISHDFVDTDYYWSLGLRGPIENVIVDAKRRFRLTQIASSSFCRSRRCTFIGTTSRVE